MDEPVIEELENLMDDSYPDPVIEELDWYDDVYNDDRTVTLTVNQYLHLCDNKKCISNVLVEKTICPLCGDKVKKYNKIKISDDDIFD